VAVGNVLIVVVPLVILLGVLAGIGIIVRFLRARGSSASSSSGVRPEWRTACCSSRSR
jgi:hypothetical protein